MAYENIICSVEKGVATIRLNRPDILNAFEFQMIEEFEDATLKMARDEQVGAVIITGTGRAFSAGGDLKQMQKEFNTVAGRDYLTRSHPWLMQFVQMEKPVIAAVNGIAAGAGFSISLLCDFIFASDNATFSQPFIQVGLVPDMGSMYFLPRLIGLPRAKELFVTGKRLTAAEAHAWGIVNRVVAGDSLLQESQAFGERLSAGPRTAIKLGKRIMNMSVNLSLEQLIEYESGAQAICFQTDDHREAVRAFFEKRAPEFKGS